MLFLHVGESSPWPVRLRRLRYRQRLRPTWQPACMVHLVHHKPCVRPSSAVVHPTGGVCLQPWSPASATMNHAWHSTYCATRNHA
jgi:hypothetical protein